MSTSKYISDVVVGDVVYCGIPGDVIWVKVVDVERLFDGDDKPLVILHTDGGAARRYRPDMTISFKEV